MPNLSLPSFLAVLAPSLALGLVLPSLGVLGGEQHGNRQSGVLSTVSTFHSVGLYWRPTSGASDRHAAVRYRPKGSWSWKMAHSLWFDDRVHVDVPERSREYRGSIVGLTPGTEYEIEVRILRGNEQARTVAKTWSESVPVGRTIWQPPSSAATLEIKQSGSPAGYVLFTPAPGRKATIDAAGVIDYNVVIDASYVIVRGLELRNAGQHAILLRRGAHHVIIEDNDISGWGRIADDGFGVDEQSAISNVDAASGEHHSEMPSIRSLVIQNNRIHHPRSGANAWNQYRQIYQSFHSAGPQAVTLWETGGNHVIRYNDIFSDEAHAFNDAIGGGENFGAGGAPGPDSGYLRQQDLRLLG